jgi:hypothetical protein
MGNEKLYRQLGAVLEDVRAVSAKHVAEGVPQDIVTTGIFAIVIRSARKGGLTLAQFQEAVASQWRTSDAVGYLEPGEVIDADDT